MSNLDRTRDWRTYLSDYTITFDDRDDGVFFAGEVIKGKVTCKVKKEMKVKAINVMVRLPYTSCSCPRALAPEQPAEGLPFPPHDDSLTRAHRSCRGPATCTASEARTSTTAARHTSKSE